MHLPVELFVYRLFVKVHSGYCRDWQVIKFIASDRTGMEATFISKL